MDVTYVSAFYNIYDDLKDEYLNYFIKFVSQGFTTILYLDKELTDWKTKLSVYSNLTIIADKSFADLPLVQMFPIETTKLPEIRNKDTYGYLILMNSKVQFVYDAISVSKTDKMAWIDFGMMKLLKRHDSVFSKLRSVTIPDDKILMPGCTPQNPVNFNHVHWRFCGSLFFGKKAIIEDFYNLNQAYMLTLQNQKILTWEVNVWAWLEINHNWKIDYYNANHNDSIINIPKEYISIVASLTSIPSRFDKCKLVIDSLINQVEHIYLNLCSEYRRFSGTFSNDNIPLYFLKDEPYKSKMTITFGKDYGPATKYLGSLEYISKLSELS